MFAFQKLESLQRATALLHQQQLQQQQQESRAREVDLIAQVDANKKAAGEWHVASTKAADALRRLQRRDGHTHTHT